MSLKSRKCKKSSVNPQLAREWIEQQNQISNETKKHEATKEIETISNLLNLSHKAMDTDNNGEDPSFELNSSVKSDMHHS